MVVGVICDADVFVNKGPTVFNEQERCSQLAECKWVNEVHIVDTYDVQISDMDRFNCEFYAHGDDAALNKDGIDAA